MFLLLVPPCYGAQQEREVMIEPKVRDCSLRHHTTHPFPTHLGPFDLYLDSHHSIANTHGSPLHYLNRSHSHGFLDVKHSKLFQSTDKQHWTDLVLMAGWWETSANRSHMQQDSFWVSGTSWLLPFPFWHNPNCIVLRTALFFSLSSSSTIPHPQIRIHNNYCHMSADSNQADLQPQHQILYSLAHHKNGKTS
jgi:hypothetical protein